jgi:hypothetical protein
MLLLEADNSVWKQFENPKEGECLSLEAATKQWLEHMKMSSIKPLQTLPTVIHITMRT